jgi:4-alpha-glucanotransferase
MRKSGILLHPTSLPGEWGIGDLGSWAYHFAEFLAEGGFQLWQILPLGPPGFKDSPYQALSSTAGNPLLISPQLLVEQGWLSAGDLLDMPRASGSLVDFGAVIPAKMKLIRKAARSFFKDASHPLHKEFSDFCSRMKPWLDAYAEFASLKEANLKAPWIAWARESSVNAQDVLEQKFMQFEFFREWKALKEYCNDLGIGIIGDLPFFVAHDSADVWANPDLFDLDVRGNPETVAGVPPDYFSETGQRWGNPLYRWDRMEQTGFRWWIDRVRFMLETVDIIRLDHFRGFESYWRIPGGEETAIHGTWVPGPGDRLLEALKQSLGTLPFIAEDLGIITPEVLELRDRWGFPGMRVLQFAFGDPSPDNPHKPFNYVRNCVVYTGTHDNDTSAGWFRRKAVGEARSEIESAQRYIGMGGDEGVWSFIRILLSSVADTAILPMQDVLGLGTEARMNLPGTPENNWRWKMTVDQLKSDLSGRLRALNATYGRL